MAGKSLMWKQARRSPVIVSRSSTEPPPRIMWKTSATTVARGSSGSRGDRPGGGDVVDAVDEAEELHRRDDAEPVADFEQLGKPVAGVVQVDDFLGRAGDDIGALQLDGLRHPPPAVVEHPRRARLPPTSPNRAARSC